MYIRRVMTRRAAGETYYSYRLVESRREGGRVRQITLLNLGSHFELPEGQWGLLCLRLGQLLGQQDVLMPADAGAEMEAAAQALAARLVARAPAQNAPAVSADFVEVDVASLELVRPRSVGVEHVGLYALAQLQIEPLLQSLGINAIPCAMIIA